MTLRRLPPANLLTLATMPYRTIEVDHPVHLGHTLAMLAHGAGDPTTRLSPAEAVRASRTPAGPATLHVRIVAGRAEAEAWGPGAAWMLDGLPDLLGARDDPTAFVPPPGVVDRANRKMRGFRFGRSNLVFEVLLPHILAQKVTGKGFVRSYRALIRRHGQPAPGPLGRWLQPAPAVLAELGYEEYHPFNVERRRADTVRRAAARASRLEEAVGMDRDAATARLTALPGIGQWTAAAVRQGALGDADAVMVGDYHLKHIVAWNLAGEERGDDARMLELLEPFRPHRARVTRLLKAAGTSPPRYGPKLPVRQIAGQ